MISVARVLAIWIGISIAVLILIVIVREIAGRVARRNLTITRRPKDLDGIVRRKSWF